MVSVLSFFLYLSIVSTFTAIKAIQVPISLLNSYTILDNPLFKNPYEHLNHLVSTSLTRAHHLKNPRTPKTTTATEIYTHSYGGYSISLSFGTPPQTLSFILDTGSDFVWFPCTSRYQCKNCSIYSAKIHSFIPKQSSSSKFIGCHNPKCSWIHRSLNCDRGCNFNNSNSSSNNCSSSQICPPYIIIYGSGTTGGIALSETLHINSLTRPDFLVGCSVFSSRQPAGIAGFGRGNSSLPSQLGVDKFSYCSLSHRLDDTNITTSLVLNTMSDSDTKTTGLMYTRFVKNPEFEEKHAFSVYYYVSLRHITVGGRRVKVPDGYLSPGEDGNGGTIVDSGTTFTFMSSEVFELVSREFVSQMRSYERVYQVETLTGLSPCFNVSGTETVSFPELVLHFKGGADVALPVENYFAFVGGGSEHHVACLTVVTDDGVRGMDRSSGPGIILGNFQVQNFAMEFDLRNERLGFKQQRCS